MGKDLRYFDRIDATLKYKGGTPDEKEYFRVSGELKAPASPTGELIVFIDNIYFPDGVNLKGRKTVTFTRMDIKQNRDTPLFRLMQLLYQSKKDFDGIEEFRPGKLEISIKEVSSFTK